ncbi:GIN domain-containing protein [Cognatishimia sp.]|uniref:GIN domain-containing protein n=1 Tax=Cognatishimia sp. TaxID=2211648 RepID=UPI0035123AA1
MRNFILAAAVAGMATGALADEKTYNLDDFEDVSVSSGVTVKIAGGSDFSVVAEAKQGALWRLKLRQRGDELKISRRSFWGIWNPWRNDEFEVTITMPMLEKLDLSAGADVTVVNVVTKDLDVDVSSGASAHLTGIAAEEVSLDTASGASLWAAGQCVELDAEASSGSTLDASELQCAEAKLDGASGSVIRAWASTLAEVEGSSGAALYLAGGATLEELDLSSGASLRDQ